MKLRRGGTRAFTLPLGQPLVTAHGTISKRAGWLVSLLDEDGLVGSGEATPLPEFGTESLSESGKALDEALGQLVDGRERAFDDATAEAGRLCRGAPCAASALDSALHDLEARRAGTSLAQWIHRRAGASAPFAPRVSVQALLVGETPAAVESAALAALARGFETFKLKLAASASRSVADGAGAGRGGAREADDFGRDLERVAALRQAIGPGRRIRLDANEAWTTAQAHAAMSALRPFAIDYLEQPVPRRDLEGLKELDMNGAVPVAADEALLGSGLEACLALRAASILVVKPAALGGIAPSIELFLRAREAGLRVVWSSLIDGAVGRAGALALAAGLGPADEAHGLGTAGLLARDLVPDLVEPGGAIEVPASPGLGCVPIPAWRGDEGSERASSIVEAPR